MRARTLFALIVLCALPRLAVASGHGPLFGAATPTLGKGGWQLDQAWMARLGEGPGTEEQTLRTMVSFGITEDLQISASLPITLETSFFMPRGRMMASAREFEAIAAWRVQRKATGSARVESTVFLGGALPLGIVVQSLKTAGK